MMNLYDMIAEYLNTIDDFEDEGTDMESFIRQVVRERLEE